MCVGMNEPQKENIGKNEHIMKKHMKYHSNHVHIWRIYNLVRYTHVVKLERKTTGICTVIVSFNGGEKEM